MRLTTWHKLAVSILITISAVTSNAQYTKLLNFGTSDDGYFPYAAPISDGTYLYGVSTTGGTNDYGTIYKMKPDGSGFAKLFDFDGDLTGGHPYGSLCSDGTFLYGVTQSGGPKGYGVIFKVKLDGTGYTDLYEFDYSTTGAYAVGGLISDGTFLYGMTGIGGPSSYGTLYKVKLDGSGFTVVLNFDGGGNGAAPYNSLLFDGTYLYGTTSGGFSWNGNVFKIKPDGTGYLKLIDFAGSSNGKNPRGALITDGTYLYGTTQTGGSNGNGTIFKVLKDGTGYVKVYDFSSASPIGAYPKGTMAYDGTFLYGTTNDFGATGRGTIFKIKPDGTGLLKLADHDVGSNNQQSDGSLLLIGTTLYTVKSGGGAGAAPFLPGSLVKINTDGTGYAHLHDFKRTGYNPSGTLYSDGTYNYGLTQNGGLYDYGVVFKVKPDGTGYTELLNFDDANGKNGIGSFTSDGTFLYGMTDQGGANGYGVIFKINTDGTGYAKLLDFDFTNNGNAPSGSLIHESGYLYGTTSNGGANSSGTIFKIKTDGTGYVKLLDFDYTNNGASPRGELLMDASFLYGTTFQGGTGGSGGWGTLYKIKRDGTGYTKLFDFDNDDINKGSNPTGTLITDGTYLYGMTENGGYSASGIIYKIKPDGTGFTKLFDFDGDSNVGTNPHGSLITDGTYLYGMATYGGYNGFGTVFRIRNDGTGFLKLFDFDDLGGSYPIGSLISDATFLYGMTSTGGTVNAGAYFKLPKIPFVAITDFKPKEGPEGTYVTIYGNAFDDVAANNTVKFNGVTAEVISSTTSTINAIVPAGATTGPISVTVNGQTATSVTSFTVTNDIAIFNGTIKSCDVSFHEPNSADDLGLTFIPAGAGTKIKLSFTSFNVDDRIEVYDGPNTSSPLVATLDGNSIPADIVSTSAGGELTVRWVWQDASSLWDARITCVSPNGSIEIEPSQLSAAQGGLVTLDLVPLITTTNSNLDLGSLTVDTQPTSGAIASISPAGVLTINYTGKSFTGQDQISIRACDDKGNCTTRTFTIEVSEVADLVVYNAVSPNGVNPSLIIDHIDQLPDTKDNTVYIFDRWENQVWHGTNYNNTSTVFTGVSDGGAELPTGVYYYKIDFASGRKKMTGFISLRRQ